MADKLTREQIENLKAAVADSMTIVPSTGDLSYRARKAIIALCDMALSPALTAAREALEKAKQLASVAEDWNLYEVEIDGQMVRTPKLEAEFDSALALLKEQTHG